MDVNSFVNLGGDYVRNPNYKKSNGQPKYIRSVDTPVSNVGSTLLNAGATYPTVFNPDAESDRLARGMLDEKLALRRDDYLNNNFTKILADSQSVLEQARNSLIQTVSEGTLGTVKAFADLFDLLTLQELRNDTGYQNPVSAQIEEWQKAIRENVAPIYQDPDVNVLNGGLVNSGFIFGGLPSVVSSLTLLIPSKAVTWGLTKGTKFITKQGVKMMRAMEKAHRANQIGEAAETTGRSASAALNAFVEGRRGQRLSNLTDFAVSGLTSRLLENYQESRQTYDDAKPLYYQILKDMENKDPEAKAEVINGLIEKYGKDAADWNSDDSIANLVAQKSADETFKDDMWNIFSDVYQMYAIGKIGRAINGPSRAALRRLNRQNINYVGMSDDAIKKILDSRTRLQKIGDKASDLAFGAKHTILSELSEGAEEAVNYIAQEEGFHYGKVLLNQEADNDFWSDRFIDYLQAPKLWDSAFWGVMGGVIFNAGAEYSNRFINAINTIQQAKQDAKTQVNDPNNPVKIPTFREAFADTELGIRKANLESNKKRFEQTKKKLENINDGKDIYKITTDGVLKTDEEKEVARRRALLEFRDDVLLDAMDAGNYDLAREYLASDQLKQFFVDNGIMSQEEANRAQSEILTEGDELRKSYDKQLRLIYNAVSDWGKENKADLSSIPAEVFGTIARQNIRLELENKHYQKQIDALKRANAVLEADSSEELEKAARENGVTDFRGIIEQIGRAHQLGMVRAEIADIKRKKQHLDVAGQAMLRNYEETERMLVDEIVKNSQVTSTGLNGESITNDVQTAVNLLLSAQGAASVEIIPGSTSKSKERYIANEAAEKFTKLADAVSRRDRKLLKELLPSIGAILDSNPSTETDKDTFLNEVVEVANARNEILKNLHDREGKIKVLQNINSQLEANYREIAALELNKLYNKTKIKSTKEQIQSRANDIINELNQGRAVALKTASIMYQQLAKKYGKDRIKDEIKSQVLNNEHTDVYTEFTQEEKSAYDYMTKLAKWQRAEQDIVLSDIYKALDENEIYEYSKDEDAIAIINESIKKAKEKAATSQNSNTGSQSSGLNNSSDDTLETADGQGNRQINDNGDEFVPFEDGEQTEGTIDPDTAPDTTGGSTEGNEEPAGRQQNVSPIESNVNELFNILSNRQDSVSHNVTEGAKKALIAELNDIDVNKKYDDIINDIYNAFNTVGWGKYWNNRDSIFDWRKLVTSILNKNESGEQAPDSSTGGQEISRSDIIKIVDAQVKALEQSNPEGVTKQVLRDQIKQGLTESLSSVDEDTIDNLIDTTLDTLDEIYEEEEGESIESKLAKNIIRLSTIAANSKIDSVIREANAILDRTFENLLDNFNRHLSHGIVNGKYIIPLDALLRYAKHITNNEVEAQEMYNAFTKIIADHPEKYRTIKGKVLTPTKLVQHVESSVSQLRQNLDTSIGGRTFNINGMLAIIDDDRKLTDDQKKEAKAKVIEAVKSLRPGSKIYVRRNNDNAKEKTKDPDGGWFVGGIDFIVIDNDNHETLIAKAPSPMYPNGETGSKDRYNAMLEGWFYEIPLGREMGKKEYPIQTFFKKLFIDDSKEAKAFRAYLLEYETLTGEEAYGKEGNELLDKAYEALKDYAGSIGVDITPFTQRSKRNTEGNRERIRHLASLDVYTQDKWNLDVEELDYETFDEDTDLRSESYRESIDRWFNKMVESNEARRIITEVLDHATTNDILDVGVEVESVGKPVLVKTKEDKALPATQAIAEQHKGEIHLAAGDRSNRSQVVVSDGQPLNMGGVDTTGRSVVVINTPDGQRNYINAYPVRANSKIFENNDALAAFKEALETKLFELMDQWFLNPNSENLQQFLDMLGHKSRETSKIGGSLFAGFFRSVLPNGNGFSIKYKVDAEGNIISPTSKEEGEVHFLTFYDTVPILNGRRAGTTKARAAVQDFVEGRERNKTVIWNTNPNDTSTLTDIEQMKDIIRKVLIDSLAVRIDPININADNDSKISYGSFLDRDADGHLVLKVTGIKKPGKKAKAYAQPNGDIIISNVGRDGKAGNFSDFIIFNDMVNLTTRPIGGSNFTVFDNTEGDFGVQYRLIKSTPVGKVTVEPVAEPLSKIVKDIINNHKANTNVSKAIIKAIVTRLAKEDSSLYNLTKNSTILNKLLHKKVTFVEGFNGATYMQNGEVVAISDKAYAFYVTTDVEIEINGKKTTLKEGDIVVGDKFMELLDGTTADIADALHHLLHENVHGFIADNDTANPEKNAKYKKELNELWDEYSKKHPTSPHAKSNPDMDLEEFIVESLTNINLIKELNETPADVPLNNPKSPKTLLGKLFDKLLNWLSDLLVGPNGEKFEVQKDNLLAKEYAIFEEAIANSGETRTPTRTRTKRAAKPEVKQNQSQYTEGTLNFEEDEAVETGETNAGDDGVVGFEIKIPKDSQQTSSTGGPTIQNDNRTKAPKRRRGMKSSTIRMTFPTLQGALNQVSADTYFDVTEKINNGVISIKCK